MSIREAIAERLFGDVIAARAAEAAESERGWRALAASSPRDVGAAELRENLALADEAYRNNPLAFRIVELGVDFVLGRGLTLRADDPAIEDWLRAWWSHPLNNLQLRQFELCRELSLGGELFVTLHTNPLDGMTYLRTVPAGLIDEVETSPGDVETELRFHQVGRSTDSTGNGWSGSAPRALLPSPQGEGRLGGVGAGRWWTREEMRHYAVSRLAGSVRGQGDLTALLPWLRRYRDWLVDRVRLNKYRQAFLFDVTLTGADRRTLVGRQQELAVPPEPGSIVVHNEKESWRAVRPEIGAAESAADGLALRLMIAAGSGFPLHFLGEAAEANLATATAMAAPALRRLERRQLYFGWVVVDLARECLRRSGRFGDADAIALRAEFAELSAEDNERVAGAAAAAAGALRTAQEMGWLGREEAGETFGRFVGGRT